MVEVLSSNISTSLVISKQGPELSHANSNCHQVNETPLKFTGVNSSTQESLVNTLKKRSVETSL